MYYGIDTTVYICDSRVSMKNVLTFCVSTVYFSTLGENNGENLPFSCIC
jgi:hypothetical protein